MSTRHVMAFGISPLFLRLALGIVFIWAGMGKISATMEVEGEAAATLANMGVIKPAPRGGTPPPGAPTKPLPSPEEPSDEPGDAGGRVDAGGGLLPAAYASQDAGQPPAPGSGSAPAPSSSLYAAEDFPEKVSVRQLYGVALAIHGAAHPTASPQNPSAKAIWPAPLAGGRMPVILAYLVTAAELGGGILVLIGLFTRFGSFSIALVMAGAMWLSQIGPALQKGATVLGFLPDHARFDPAWTTLVLQFVLFSMAMSLLCSGPGYFALDHAFFGRRHRVEDHDEE